MTNLLVETSNRGGALIGAILFSALMLSLSAIIFKNTISKKGLVQNLQVSLALREEIIKKLKEGQLHAVEKQTRKLEREIFKAGDFEASLSWSNKRIDFPSPDWNLLEALPKKDCYQSNQKTRATAALSCLGLEDFFPAYGGNILSKQDQFLKLPLYFIGGDFEIDGELILNPENSLTLVIAVGNIKIKQVSGEDHQQLILYSASNTIEIAEEVSALALCEESGPSFKLSLMAPKNLFSFIGCPPKLSEILWPKESLLAYQIP